MVGLTCANLLALGAAIGTWAFSINSRAIGFYGLRIPTKPVYAVITSGMIDDDFTAIVNGPGQKLLAKWVNTYFSLYVTSISGKA